MYGVDNWEDIAKIIQTRNKRETEMHFHMLYLNPKTAPIPDMSRDTLLPKDDPEWYSCDLRQQSADWKTRIRWCPDRDGVRVFLCLSLLLFFAILVG